MTIPKFLLGNLCNFTQGIQIPASETIKSKTKGFIRYLYIRDFFTDKFQVFVEDKYPNKILSTNDIVMVNTGATAGDVYRGKEGVLCNNAFKIHIKINQKNRLDAEYLWHYLNSEEKDRLLKKLFNNAGQPHVGHGNVAKLKIPLPPIPEQRKIAEILSTWDEAIAKTEQLIEALRQRKKGLMQRLLTGQVRFPGFEDEWKENKLGELFSERAERGFDHLPLLSVSENGISYRDESNRKDNSSDNKSKYLRICPGDLGYNTMRMWQGRSAISPYEGIVSPAYTILKPKKGVDVRFMAYLFKYKPMIHNFYRYSQGLVSDTWSLKFPSFKKIIVNVPEYEEQQKIANLLELCDKEINEMQSYSEYLQLQKKGLMQRLLTGQVRVKVE